MQILHFYPLSASLRTRKNVTNGSQNQLEKNKSGIKRKYKIINSE